MSADLNPDLQRLGACLQEARVREGLSLDDLAQRLHMGKEQLCSLEEADEAGLPEPVFVIAQARRVACALGVNVDAEIQALRRSQSDARPVRVPTTSGDAPEPSQPAASHAHAEKPKPVRRPSPSRGGNGSGTGLKVLVLVLLLGGLGVAGSWAWRTFSAGTAIPGSPAAPESPANPSSGTKPSTAATATPAASIAEGTALQIRALQPSWLEVRTAAGTSLYRGTLKGEKQFPFQGDLLVLAGRPDLVEVKAPQAAVRRLGTIDQVRWERFRAPAP